MSDCVVLGIVAAVASCISALCATYVAVVTIGRHAGKAECEARRVPK